MAMEGYDEEEAALKSKLLRSLLREYVPDEKHAFTNPPSELSYVVSTIKTQKLLSYVTSDSSAVDSWVNRLTALASPNSSPDKCWAGVCLLGVTIEECSSERFLASYGVWLDKLIPLIQIAAVPHFVKAASCASLSDLFTRLSGFSNAKKDGTSQASKVVQPALRLLNEGISAVVLEEVICLLCTLIESFPSSIHRHYDSVEAAIVPMLMSGKCSSSLVKKLSYGLSSLPKSRGDEGTWSLMMEKILICLNNHLNDAFQGLEEEARSREILRILLPTGKEPPPPLGGVTTSVENSDLSARRPERLLGSRISTLMQCCHDMLTNSYPVMVPVPIHALIALVGRVLMVDGSLSLSSYSYMSTLKQELICSEIPLLQSHILEILAAVVKGLSSHLLPHAAGIVQLLTKYLRRCTLPDLRLKAYSIVKALLMSMGIGLAIHISQDVVSNILIDLDDLKDSKSSSKNSEVRADSLSESRPKKRKLSSTPRDGLQVEMPQNLTPMSVKIAALEALEALLLVGGSMRSESWRENVDDLLMHVAKDACKAGLSRDERNIFLSGDHMPIWTDFQQAALRALVASLLSPRHVRPSHLALALELFRKGALETGTKLAEYCGHALLTLEVLIHPRVLPLSDMCSNIDDYRTLSNTFHKNSGPAQISTYQAGGSSGQHQESEYDEMHANWSEDDDVLEAPVADKQLDGKYTETQQLDGKYTETPPVKDDSITKTPIEIEKNMGDRDDHMVDGHLGASESVELEPASTKDDGVTKILDRISATLVPDGELSDCSLPDIVDGDPDSDYIDGEN